MEEQKQWIEGLSLVWTWRRLSSESAFLWSGLGDAFQLPKEDLEGAVRLLRTPGTCAVRRLCGRAAPDHHGHFARVNVSCLLLRIVLQDALVKLHKFTLR